MHCQIIYTIIYTTLQPVLSVESNKVVSLKPPTSDLLCFEGCRVFREIGIMEDETPE
jgi:hypothetical protein